MKERIKQEFPYHRIFLVLGLIFGIIWLFLLPPFQGPDEFGHFRRAYMLSEGKLHLDSEPVTGRVGCYLPASIKQLEDALQSRKIVGRTAIKQDFTALAASSKIELKPRSELFYDDIANYPPVAYAPQVVAVTIARILELPILYVYYAGRFGSLIFFIVSMYLLIKHVLILQLPLLTIALMPISIQQGIIISADCVTIILLLMLVCHAVNIAFREEEKAVGVKDMAALYLLCALIALTKGPYIVLALLYFIMIPREKFRSGALYWIGGFGMIIFGLIFAVAWKMFQVHLIAAPTINQVMGVAPDRDLNPFHILYRVYFETMFSVYLAKSTFWLGWTDVRLPFIFLAVFTVLLLWPLLVPDMGISDKSAKFRKTGLAIVGFIFLIWTAYHISMYLMERQKPDGKILGMQGRYFVRILFPFLVGIYLVIPEKMRLWTTSKIKCGVGTLIKIHLVLLAVFLSIATWYIYARYYLS
ncbi:MAG TPA: DUF2142 domain-containing protein [Dissulfurispiraceae bacterium]|nr:DUF2142 domain-containing protein [Dissulfurispiraceae bacterium]